MTNKPKHILFISDWYPHKEGPFDGIFIQKLALCVQRQADWQVSNLSFHAHEGNYKVEEQDFEGVHEVRIYYPENAPKWRRHQRVYNIIKSYSHQLAAIYGPVRLIQANIMPFAAWYAYRLAKHLKIPYGIREGYSVYLDDQFLQFPWLKRKMTRFLIERAQFVVAISSALSKALQRHFHRVQPIVIPNPVLPNRPQARSPISPPQIVSIADFYPYKRIDLLLEAFAEAILQQPGWQLVLYGKGVLEDTLRNLADAMDIADRVHFKGTIPNDEIYRRLPNYQFLVISSEVETFSNVGIEALACGVPVLATDCGGPADFVTESNGLLIAPNQTEALIAGLLHMMTHGANFDRQAIQKAAQHQFSMEMIGRQYVTLYEQVIAK